MKQKSVQLWGLCLALALTMIFIFLKATNSIAWEWVWIVSPLWIFVLPSAILAPFALGMYLADKSMRKQKKEMEQQIGEAPSRWKDKLNEMKRNGAID